MGNPYSDKVEAEVLEPIVLNPNTVNEYDDAAVLKQNELSIADNVIFDNKMIEKSKGTQKYNTDTANNPVYALHRSYRKDGSTPILLRMANSKLESVTDVSTTTILTGMASLKTPFVDIKGRAYGVNTTDGIIRHDPIKNQGLKTAIIGPYLRKEIAFFEADETWNLGSGDGTATQSTDHYRADEYSGTSAYSLAVTATAQTSAYADLTLNLSTFSNSKASSNDDLICFYCMPSSYANITYIVIALQTDTSNYYYTTICKADFEPYPFEWNKFEIKKSAFLTFGTPSWATITRVSFNCVCSASTTFYIDFMHLKAAKIYGVEMRRQIANCDTGDSFSGTGVSIVSTPYYEYSQTKNASLQFYASGAGAITATATITSVDLSTWPNGGTSSDSDEIVFYIRCNTVSDLAADTALVIKLGTSDSVYWERELKNAAAIGVTDKDNQWIEVRIKKTSDAADREVGWVSNGGIAAWSGIVYCQIAITFGATGYIYIDDIHMEPYQNVQTIELFETATEWTFPTGFTTVGDALYGAGGDIRGIPSNMQKLGLGQGSNCLALWGGPLTVREPYATHDFSGDDKDLSTFDGTVLSSTDDFISFSMYHQYKPNVEWVEIWLDGNDLATFAAAFKYRITPDYFAEKDLHDGTIINIKKSDFDQVGSPDWSKIGAVRFYVRGKGNYNDVGAGGAVVFDNLVMKRKKGNTGRYYYKYAFVMKDVVSPCSEISDAVDVRGAFVSLSNIATSQDSRVTARRIYRLGGSYPTTWMLAGTIENNTDTTWVDEIDDNDLVYPIGDDVPTGNIENVSCSNLAYDPVSDCALYWGDSTYKNRIYKSNQGYYHVVNETSYREMPDDVMFVQPWHGQIIVFFKHGKKKIMGDIFTGDLVDLPVTTGACSYYGVKKVSRSIIASCGWDNVYLFDGYKDIEIGNEVKNFFDGMEAYLQYMVMGYHNDTIYISCYDTSSSTYNDNVLRYHIPTKSWSILPDWNVNMWCNWDQQSDQNQFTYGDSVTNNVMKINYSTYQFISSAISSSFATGWINDPNQEIALHHIELKAKGTNASELKFYGYKDYSTSATSTGTITFSDSTPKWRTYRLGPKNIWNKLRGDALQIKFTHSTDSGYFKVKDLVLYIEKLPKRITLNEVTIS